MDMIIMAVLGVLFCIIGAVVALVMKKPKLRILGFAIAGLVLGTLTGYLIAPTIISFM